MFDIPDPISGYLSGLAADLAKRLLSKGAGRLRDEMFGDAEQRAMQAVWEKAFATMLAEVAGDKSREQVDLLGDIFRDFVGDDPAVAEALLDAVLEDRTPDLDLLEKRFDQAFVRESLGVEFRPAMGALLDGFAAALVDSAGKPNSPIYNRVSTEKLAVIVRELTTHGEKLDRIIEILTQNRTRPPIGPRRPEPGEEPPLPRGDFREPPARAIRRAELDRLDALLRQGSGNAAITGKSAAVHAPGGIGKSVLATLYALDDNTRRHFIDGIYWLEFGKTPDLAALQLRLGRLLGDAGDTRDYADLKTGRDRLTALVDGRRALFVLDDIWDASHVAHFVLPAAECRWLMTTRLTGLGLRLGYSGDQVIKLDYLTPDQGVALIAGVLGLDEATDYADKSLHRELSIELGGHTQAIAISAARLRPDYDGGLSVAELLARLRADRDTPNPLGELALEGEERERNLERSLAESYEYLSDGDRARFRALGAFAPETTFGVAAVSAVWGADERTTRDALGRLVGASLLNRAGERYSQHGLLRAYALALLRRDAEEAAARQRHFGYYAGEYGDHERNLAYASEGRHAAITADFDDLRHGLEWAFDAEPAAACDLLGALENSYLQFAQPAATTRQLLERGLAAATSIGYQRGQANVLQALGDVALRHNEYAEARRLYDEARPLYAAIGARLGEANVLKSLGDVALRQNEYAEARRLYDEARPLYAAIGARLGEANVLKALGDVALMQNEYAEARRLYDEARPLYAAIGARAGLANILHNSQLLALASGDKSAALGYLSDAVDFNLQFAPVHPDTFGWADILVALRSELGRREAGGGG